MVLLSYLMSRTDWKVLRCNHRIIGDIVGCSQFLPSLPIALLPEEVSLLLNKEIITLVEYKKLFKNDANDLDVYNNLSKKLLEEEQKIYIESRKQQLECMKDKIILAKRNKGDLRSPEEILEESKKPLVNENNMLWPIFMQHLKETKGESAPVNPNAILQKTTSIKCRIFEDLWSRGYYVSLGHKFGGDFLTYVGDPILYHAVFIIHCVEDIRKELNSTEIIAYGRLGNSVKKRAVLASLDSNNKISYITLNWMDI